MNLAQESEVYAVLSSAREYLATGQEADLEWLERICAAFLVSTRSVQCLGIEATVIANRAEFDLCDGTPDSLETDLEWLKTRFHNEGVSP